MAVDWQGLSVAVGAVGAVIASVIGGYYTGTNNRRKDKQVWDLAQQEAEAKREIAEDQASAQRIEAIAADATAARKRARDLEDEFDARLRAMRKSEQMGWDLAQYHFGLVSVLAHLINNMTTVATMSDHPDPDRVLSVVLNAKKRMDTIVIPTALEDPLQKTLPVMVESSGARLGLAAPQSSTLPGVVDRPGESPA